MNIKNYTSGIPVESTISRIEAKLAAAGASGITKLYGPDKRVSALVFSIEINGRPSPLQIKVPVNSNACFEALWKQHCQNHSQQREAAKVRIRDQAARTAWKLMQDWIEVQISMILMRQAEFVEVFMPYVWDGKQTFFESVKGGNFMALPERCEA